MSEAVVRLVMKFTLPVECSELFAFIGRAENMVLYTGCFFIPGIKKSTSSDSERKVGTLDAICNTDGSSHDARTVVFDKDARYSTYLDNFRMIGFKSKLANPIVAFKEDWIYTRQGSSTHIERSIDIIYKKGLFNSLLVKYFIYPQLYFSFLKHRQNIGKAFA